MSTPISQLPHIPPTVANDPMITNELMQEQGAKSSGSFFDDPMVKESIGLIILFVVMHSEFVNGLLTQYLPGMVETSVMHTQTTVIKAVIFGIAVFVIRKWLL